MPRENITSTTRFVDVNPEDYPPGSTVANTRSLDLSVGWGRDLGWVQLRSIPRGWKDTGEGTHYDLGPDEIDHLIQALRRAKRQAFPAPHGVCGVTDCKVC